MYNEKGMMRAYLTGIADWFSYNTRCPVYWKGKPEGEAWERGYKYGKNFNKGDTSDK